MNVMREAMNSAMEDKKINSYKWKGRKQLDANGKYQQNEQRMVDMSEAELNSAYEHCKTMLFNKDQRNPGRYIVLQLIEEQKNKCGAELYLQYLKREKGIDRYPLTKSITTFKQNNREVFAAREVMIQEALEVPNQFTDIPIDTILDGCLDKLGAFDKKHVTRALILRQGVWLTPSEAKDLTEKDSNNNIIDKLTVIRERLNIKDVEKLSINSRGLSYSELRAMINLKSNKKYADLTTLQLETLRNRMLFVLEESVRKHIASWENRMLQIEKVAEYLSIPLY